MTEEVVLPVTPTPTPVVTPVPPVAPVQPVVEPVQPTPVVPQGEIKGFTPTGQPGIDIALGFFSKHGLTEQHPAVQEAALRGNFDYLKAHFAELGGKAAGWEQYLGLAEKGYNDFKQGETAAYEQRLKTVHDAVGGEENWKEVQAWVSTNAEPEEKAAVKQAFALGGIAAQAMAVFLQNQMRGTPGVTVPHAEAVQHQQNTPMQGQPLTAQGYTAEVNALVAQVGHNGMDRDPRYHALRQKYAAVLGR